MPKRSYEERIDYYMKKMEKLRDKHRHKHRRREDSFSYSDDDNPQGDETAMWDLSQQPVETEPQPGLEPEDTVIIPDPDEPRPDILLESVSTQQDDLKSLPPAPPAPAALPEPPLDPEILSALGEATDEGPIWGPEIHNNLTQLWLPLLKKGMVKEMRDKILKQYLIPSNCTLLQAPKLNIEISAAVPEMVRLRDKKVETSQQQLGAGITAISKAMTSLITSDNKIEAIKTLSDGCRILCDLHNSETQARIKMVTPGLAKPFLNVIQDSERDETLFGSTLPDKIKASKTIEKQGLQIKKTVPLPVKSNNNAQSQNTMSARHQFQGNWVGPSRYPTNRGGARGSEEIPHVSTSISGGDGDSDVANQGEPEPVTCPCTPVAQVHAARVQHFYNCWTHITNNTSILNWIMKGIPIPFICEPYQTCIPRITWSLSEQRDMSLAVENLTELGAISQVEPSSDQFISSTFLAPKSNGGKRFILNLKSLNRFIPKTHFKMEDSRTACKLVQSNWYMATVDMKEAYLLIPVAKQF